MDKNIKFRDNKSSTDLSDEAISRNNCENSKRNIPDRRKKKIIIIISIIVPLIILAAVSISCYFIIKSKKNKNSEQNNNNSINDNPNNDHNPLPSQEQEEPDIKINEIKRMSLTMTSNDELLIEGKNKIISFNENQNYNFFSYKEIQKGNEINYSNKNNYAICLEDCLSKENNENPSLRRELDSQNDIALCLLNLTDDNKLLSIKCNNFFPENKILQLISDLDYIIYSLNNKENKNDITSCGYKCKKNTIINTYNNSENFEFFISENKTTNNGYRKTKRIKIDKKNLNVLEDTKKKLIEEIKVINKNNKELLIINNGENEKIIKTQNNSNDISTYDESLNEINNKDNYNEISLFEHEILDFKISLNNRISKEEGDIKANLILKINNLVYNFNYLSKTLEIEDIKNTISERNHINKLGKDLSDKISNDLDNLTNIIYGNFSLLNKKINQSNFKEIFSEEKKNFSNESFIKESLKTKEGLESILNEVDGEKAYTDEINSNITKYTRDSQELINQIYENLKNIKDSIKLDTNNIYTKISYYYLNNTSNSLVDKIKDANNIFSDYYKNEKEIINKEIKNMINKFKNNISTINEINDFKYYYKFNDSNDEKEIEDNLKNLKDYIINIASKVKGEVENKITTKDNGYFISEEDINLNNNKFTEIINELSDIIKSIDKDEIINSYVDKKYDEIMIKFKKNYIDALKYLDKEKDEQFPLNEDVLKDTFLSPEEQQKIKNDLETLSNDIIDNITNFNNLYLNNNQEVPNESVKNELNSFILGINIIFSNESLKELSNSFINTINNYLLKMKEEILKIKESLDNNINFFYDNKKILEKLNKQNNNTNNNNNKNIILKKITKTFLNKYKKYQDYFNSTNNYINNQFDLDLYEVYHNIINKIKDILIELKSKYIQMPKFNYINEHINIINNILNERINLYFYEGIFRNNNKNELIKILEDINKDIKDKKDKLQTKYFDSKENEDKDIYIKLGPNDYDYIDTFDEKELNNLLNISIYVNDSNYILFNNKFNIFYNTTLNESNNFSPYFNYIEQGTKGKNELILDLEPISDNIISVLDEKYSENLINSCYNYYQSITNDKIKKILNEFLSKLSNTLDLCKDDINNNFGTFKYSIGEFGYMAKIIENIIDQNITKNYFDLIIDMQRNSFNYTISYYYNNFINLVELTHKNIINKLLPLKESNLNNIIEENKNKINNKFNEIITKINNSKNELLNIQMQGYLLQVPQTNFFKANKILSDNVLSSRNILQPKSNEISSFDNRKLNNGYSISNKLYLENSDNAKIYKEFYNIIYDNNFTILNEKNFEDIILNNMIFDKSELINKLNFEIYNLNLENEMKITEYIENYTELFKEHISKYFTNENKNGIYEKINISFNKINFEENKIKEINKNINDILDKIEENILNEKKRIENYNEISYKYDYTKIEERLNEYKKEIINEIETNIKDVISELKDKITEKIYDNIVENDLNNYLSETKNYAKNIKKYEILSNSYNIGNIIGNSIENLVNNYKGLIKKQISYKYHMKLIDIINIEDIKKLINNKIDNAYNNYLLPILKEKYKREANNIYDFSSEIINDINTIKISKLNNIKNIILSLKDNYQLDINNIPNLSIDDINKNLSDIRNGIEEYISIANNYDKKNLTISLKDIIISYFTSSLNNTISLFGNEFFDRYFENNLIFKIKNLYNNIRYNLVQTILYYRIIYEFLGDKKLPNDLLNKIYDLNNIDKILENKRKEILNIINEQIIIFTNKIRNYTIDKYISNIKEDFVTESNFNDIIKEIINNVINDINMEDLEEKYNIIFNNTLYEKINKTYLKKLNEDTNDVIAIIEKQRKDLKNNMPLDKNDNNIELKNINSELDKATASINKYIDYYNSFKISEELISNMINDYKNKIDSSFKNLVEYLNKAKNEIKNSFNEKFKNIENHINIDNFYKNSNDTLSSMKKYINNIEEKINKNMENKKRNLDDNLINNDNEEISTGEFKENIFFDNLLNSSKRNKEYIDNYEDFDKKINDYMNNLDISYKYSKILIENSNYQKDIKTYFEDKLSKIKDMNIDYLKNINNTFYNIKKYLNESIYNINEILDKNCQKQKNLLKIYENNINNQINKRNDNFIPIYNKSSNIVLISNEQFNISITLFYNKVNEFELKFENNINGPKILAYLKNEIRPNKMEIDIEKLETYKNILKIDFNDKDNSNMNQYTFEFQDLQNNSNDESITKYFEKKSNKELILID